MAPWAPSVALLAMTVGASAFSLPRVAAPPLRGAAAMPISMVMETEPSVVVKKAAVETDLDKVFRRAEFWDKEKATKLEIINVLGRWDSAKEWAERTEFTQVLDVRKESYAQSATRGRYEMAQKNGLVERVALQQNAPKMPFKNAALAASVGKTVNDFQDMPVTRAAVNVVFDALVESRNGLIPPDLCDERRARMITADGGLDEAAFNAGTYRARALVILSWFLLGKGQVVGLFVALKVFADSTGVWDRINIPHIDLLFWPVALFASFRAATATVEEAEEQSSNA
mmetsp:Transcript_16793/g.46734  ORF Transcript_16793/g.46734 Transcript_16793/m.46734 type:complete len:285 (-) Transcript_16793:150-1004(-)|eukprot:scaffold153905_cov31-Tisochrysis_lutea.AAC.1